MAPTDPPADDPQDPDEILPPEGDVPDLDPEDEDILGAG